MSQVLLKGAVKRYGSTEVLHGIDLEIPARKLTVLLGPSGCGKSTLLRMIAGLEDVTEGDLVIGGEVVNDIDPSRRGCAMVFQSYALYPHQSVYRNMAFPLKMQRVAKAEIDERVRAIATMLELDELLDRLPRDLSGGQRQRVAIGRAMIRNPDVFLFDEPLSNLDAELRVKMRLEITRLQKELSATMIFVTHDQVEAMTLAHRIVVLRDGHVQQVGAPLEIYDAPANRFVAGFIGSPAMNFLSIERVEPVGAGSLLVLAGGIELSLSRTVPAETVTLGVRPEHVRIGGEGMTLPEEACREIGTEHLGDRAYHHLGTPFGELTVLQAESAVMPTSGPLSVGVDEARLHLFDVSGNALPGSGS